MQPKFSSLHSFAKLYCNHYAVYGNYKYNKKWESKKKEKKKKKKIYILFCYSWFLAMQSEADIEWICHNQHMSKSQFLHPWLSQEKSSYLY